MSLVTTEELSRQDQVDPLHTCISFNSQSNSFDQEIVTNYFLITMFKFLTKPTYRAIYSGFWFTETQLTLAGMLQQREPMAAGGTVPAARMQREMDARARLLSPVISAQSPSSWDGAVHTQGGLLTGIYLSSNSHRHARTPVPSASLDPVNLTVNIDHPDSILCNF